MSKNLEAIVSPDPQTKPGYKKTKLGYIPEDWEIVKLGQIGKVLSGLTYTPNDVTKEGLLVLRSSNVQNRTTTFDDNVFVRENIEKYNAVSKGDILICVRNGSKSLIGKSALIQEDAAGSAFGAFMSVYRSKYNAFVFQIFDTEIYHRSIQRNLGATINSINSQDLKRIEIPLPRDKEREKLVKLFSAWDRSIDKLDKLIIFKELTQKGLMQQLLTGKKRLPGFSGEWKEYKLERFFKERNEKGYENLPLLSLGEAGVYPQSESNKKDTSNKNKSKYKRICPGDIGYNTMRLWQGRNALSQLEGIISPAYTVVTPKGNAHADFFKYLFKLSKVVHKFYRNSQGLVSDTLNCKFKDFKIVTVMLPPTLDEQIAIANVLHSIDKKKELLKKKKEMLQTQKKGLMQQLLTGKKRIK